MSQTHAILETDLLSITAHELQDHLTSGRLTSVEIVQKYIEQIQNHDVYLHAVLQISPDALNEAALLDHDRELGRVRGPLHGIPILVKDNIDTDPTMGMDTTGGSVALVGSRPQGNADVINKIIGAGMIILGKTNLSELGGFKGSDITPGWSPVGGQVQSAYTICDVNPMDKMLDDSSPSGSSTGSAVAVSAGYAPLAIGTDTGGSLITPSTRASLYALRPTLGLVSQQGIIPISKHFDTAGPMAKDVCDLANLLEVMMPQSVKGVDSYVGSLTGSFADLKIGALKVNDWLFPPGVQSWSEGCKAQMISEIEAAYVKIGGMAKTFKEVTMIPPRGLMLGSSFTIFDIMTAQFEENIEGYLQTLETSNVRTLDEIIEFNNLHSDQAMPLPYDNQSQLLDAAASTMSPSEQDSYLKHIRSVGRELGIDKTLNDYDVDVILCPADSSFNLLVSAAGYPSATMPLSYTKEAGRPFGVACFTTAHGEAKLLKCLSAWEASFPKRKAPPSLVGSH